MTENIASAFDQYFYVLAADTPQLREEAFRIRYEVYVREFSYEREEDCPGGMERDDYDEQSLHCLLMHRASDTPAGCVRLVQPIHQGDTRLLPFERFCRHALDDARFDPDALRDRVSEISRLAVLGRFRRRKSDEHLPFSITEAETMSSAGRSNFPFIPISLMLAIFSQAIDHGYDYVFAMMEPRLMRLFRRYGLLFEQVGDVVDYHGMRGPFALHRDDIVPNLQPDIRELYQVIRRQLHQGPPDS